MPVDWHAAFRDKQMLHMHCYRNSTPPKKFPPLLLRQVDPHDRRHLCLCGGRGALTVLKLLNPGRDRCCARKCLATLPSDCNSQWISSMYTL